MRKLFSLFLALVATTALWAEDFSAGGIYYNILTDKTNEVEVTYRGESFSSYSNEYSGSVAIPETVTYNGTTYSVTSIGDFAFRGCYDLRSMTIPNSVTSIGKYAFYHCSGLTSITIGNSVTSIGELAFAGCSSLTSITIPNSVTSIGDRAFSGCSGLTSVTIGNNVTYIGHSAFYGCSGLTSVTIPNSVTYIGLLAFGRCSGLTSVTIPNSVTTIQGHAFAYCSGLTSATIGNSVTYIGGGAFRECSRLASITIGESVTSIEVGAFRDCTGLTSVNVLAEVPPALGDDAFYNVSKKIPVYVPCSSVSAYQSAKGWKAFTNIQCMLEDESAVDNVHSQSTNCQKLIRNGQLLILRDGVEYNAMGAQIQ